MPSSRGCPRLARVRPRATPFAGRGGALAYQWGVLEGPVEVFDAATDQLRIEVAGSGSVVAFRFDGPGAAKSIELNRTTFVRR